MGNNIVKLLNNEYNNKK